MNGIRANKSSVKSTIHIVRGSSWDIGVSLVYWASVGSLGGRGYIRVLLGSIALWGPLLGVKEFLGALLGVCMESIGGLGEVH